LITILDPLSSVASKTGDTDPIRSLVCPHPLTFIGTPSSDCNFDGDRQTIPAMLETRTAFCNFRSDISFSYVLIENPGCYKIK
jgi:hypothetical protein